MVGLQYLIILNNASVASVLLKNNKTLQVTRCGSWDGINWKDKLMSEMMTNHKIVTDFIIHFSYYKEKKDWLIDWVNDWLTDWKIDWLTDRPIDWLTNRATTRDGAASHVITSRLSNTFGYLSSLLLLLLGCKSSGIWRWNIDTPSHFFPITYDYGKGPYNSPLLLNGLVLQSIEEN